MTIQTVVEWFKDDEVKPTPYRGCLIWREDFPGLQPIEAFWTGEKWCKDVGGPLIYYCSLWCYLPIPEVKMMELEMTEESVKNFIAETAKGCEGEIKDNEWGEMACFLAPMLANDWVALRAELAEARQELDALKAIIDTRSKEYFEMKYQLDTLKVAGDAIALCLDGVLEVIPIHGLRNLVANWRNLRKEGEK